MPVYIEKSGDLVRCYYSGTNERPNEQGKIELLSHGPWKAEMSNWVIRALLFKIAIEIPPKKIFNEKC